jgi:NAD(P)-dependent dehydrogenase (short-subunit alcohol dehydrogenase family)
VQGLWHEFEQQQSCARLRVMVKAFCFCSACLYLQAVQKLADSMSGKGVDVLINNAGIFGSHSSEDLSPLKGAWCGGTRSVAWAADLPHC